ncbi:uncharacterized protein ColSpa_11363 [Colletotrichum spaethianum]|uniref:Uncharacterized protein n=1 Tax=Colletotrichum spaethianum TaxID=700344 RepID=A0AA37URP7_9PEZI|nr:uncharacterized protein ColSpa_11363 [Colletotrichum spaethianum]GKT51182.1 hypothetical protein ColSpa_11363 [Colletotrichum spaethianum]
MSSAEPGFGSLGLVLLALTTRRIVTILFYSIDLLRVNLRLISLSFRSSLLAAKLLFYSPIESCHIVLASTHNIIVACQTTLEALFCIFSYITFLFLVLPCVVIVVLLERCETVYLCLRSSRFGAAVREYLGLSPRDRPSLDQSGLSSAATDRMLNVPKKSPSSPASTRTSKLAQPTARREPCNCVQRFIRNLTVCLLILIEAAATATLPRQTKETEPKYKTFRTSWGPQKPIHTLANQSQRVTRVTNFISTVKDAVLSKIVEHWERLPTPILALRAFRLQMKSFLSDKTHTETRRTKSYHDHRPVSHYLPEEHDVSLPASPEEDLSQATQQSPAPASPPSREPQHLQLVHTKEYTHPFTGEIWDTMVYVPSGAATSLEALRNRPSALSNNPNTAPNHPDENFTGSERKVSQPTVLYRNTSSSSTFASSTSTRTATPTTPDVNPLIITTAQPSAYWTGRFLSLQDRFQGESLQDKTLSTFVTTHASKATVLAQQREVYQGRGNLPLSTTTALDRYGAASTQEAGHLSEEDNRCLRIFLHLDALCGTPEAQKSLYAWQEAYARRARRDVLLPQGTSIEKGFVARLFSGSSRQSLGASRSTKGSTKGK